MLLCSCRDHAWPLQPGGGPDHPRVCLPGSHGGPGLLCGTNQQGQKQAEAQEAQGEAPPAHAAGSPTKDPFGVTAAQPTVRAKESLRGRPWGAAHWKGITSPAAASSSLSSVGLPGACGRGSWVSLWGDLLQLQRAPRVGGVWAGWLGPLTRGGVPRYTSESSDQAELCSSKAIFYIYCWEKSL